MTCSYLRSIPEPTRRALVALCLARALTMLAAWPAARAALTFLELLLGSPNATLPGGDLLGVFNPADELIACQRRDVVPRRKRGVVGGKCHAQVGWKVVHHSTRDAPTSHASMLSKQKERTDVPEPNGGVIVERLEADVVFEERDLRSSGCGAVHRAQTKEMILLARFSSCARVAFGLVMMISYPLSSTASRVPLGLEIFAV